MSEILEAALDYARRGWTVFPAHGIRHNRCTCGRGDCSSPGKHPLTRHGVKDASSALEVIHSWWSRWPFANVALATGRASGFVVVDIDLPKATPTLGKIVHRLPRALTALTGGGGVHLFLAAPEPHGLRNHTGRLPGIAGELPGVDLRVDGGYIVAPPSRHNSGNSYSWLDPDRPIATAPAWLREPPPRPIRIPAAPKFDGDGTPYGLTALRRGLAELRAAPEGTRNHTLNRVAFKLGHLVAAGHLREGAVRSALWQCSMSIGLTRRETYSTIDSGLSSVNQ